MYFKYICALLDDLEAIEISKAHLTAQEKAKRYNYAITSWFNGHRGLIDDYAALLSCVLPEKRVDRVYVMKLTRVSRTIGSCLGLNAKPLKRLTDAPDVDRLAVELEKTVKERGDGNGNKLSISDVDHCFATLTGIQRFSSAKVRSELDSSAPRHQRDILFPVVIRLRGNEMKWFIRMLFKRLGPVQANPDLILRAAHPLLPAMLQVRESFEQALDMLDNPKLKTYMDEHGSQVDQLPLHVLQNALRPTVGCKIGRPRFMKARSFKNCADIVGSRRWSIEPKIDGEYCQVHVDLAKGDKCIQIFSKSGKDSTQDRQAVHAWIKKALRVGADVHFRRHCILEGELIVTDTRNNTILGFEQIRKHVSRSGSFIGTDQDSAPHAHEELRIIFYDVLLVDDDAVMHQPYEVRRARLKEVLPPLPGLRCRGETGMIDFTKPGANDLRQIERILKYQFKKSQAQRHEGLVLKPTDGSYLSVLPQHDGRYDGVAIKLKKDYIPGLGDTADFAVIGAYTSTSHNVEQDLLHRTRWTHYILACLANKAAVGSHGAKPMFKMMGAVTRPCISREDMIHLSHFGHLRQLHHADVGEESTPFEVQQSTTQSRPNVLFREPFIVDVLGGSFERPQNLDYFMLRHPRVVKIHNNDRGISDVVSFDELQMLAKEAREQPADVRQEEQKIKQQIRKATEPKRPKFIDQHSPAATTTTTTSPASTRSPRTPGVLIRMDSCEMHDGEQRFVSPTAAKTVGRKIAPNNGALTSRDNESHSNENPNDKQDLRKRKLELPQGISPPKKRSLGRSKSDGHDQTEPSKPAKGGDINAVRSVGEIFQTPRAPMQRSRPATPRSFLAARRSISAVASATKTEMLGKPRMDTKMSAIWNRQPLPTSLKSKWPFSDFTVLLSADVARMRHVTEDLLRLFDVSSTNELVHWQRDRRPLASDMAAVVEESQYLPGTMKIYLVDSSFGVDNENLIREVMKTRLGAGETIDVWDWRAFEEMAELDVLGGSATATKDEVQRQISRVKEHFLGSIKMTTRSATDAIKSEDFLAACKRLPDLKDAGIYEEALEYEAGEDLINIFEVPCCGDAMQECLVWFEQLTEGARNG